MSNPYKQKEERNRNRAIRSPSDKCDFAGCDRDTGVVFTLVRDATGKTKGGSFDQFANSQTRQIKDGYTFLRFITRCAECYQEDLERYRKGQTVNTRGKLL